MKALPIFARPSGRKPVFAGGPAQPAQGLATLAGWLRPGLARQLARDSHRAFRAWAFKGAARSQPMRSAKRDAARAIKAASNAAHAPRQGRAGHISLVGAGPGARDLLTLRAVKRLQEADVIFYDRLVDPEVLELARRGAKRVFVGKHVGAHAVPQSKISAMIVTEALKGRRVVRLKSGDPGIFGRASEELEAAHAAGVSIDLVPGVTAASAAGASLGQSLTERGVADTFVIATGTGSAENPLPDCTRLSGPGTTTAFYMSVRQAGRISARLMEQGLPPHAPIHICVDVSKAGERHIATTLGDLPAAVEGQKVEGCAIILVTWPQSLAEALPEPRHHAPRLVSA